MVLGYAVVGDFCEEYAKADSWRIAQLKGARSLT